MAEELQQKAYLNDQIPYLDSVHDFWKERKLTKVHGQDKMDEYSLDTNIDFIRENLLNLLLKKKSFTRPQGLDSSAVMSSLIKLLLPKTDKTNGVTSVTSNFESTVEKYYEHELPTQLHGDTREEITYSEIIKSYKDAQVASKLAAGGTAVVPEVVQRYKNSRGGNYILTMTDDSYGTIFKNHSYMNMIANFILYYYDLGDYTFANTIGLTCDAKIGLPGKIFRNIEQVYNLITPANIADSATTTFKALNNRNVYQFRSNVPSEPTKYNFTSNAFTCIPAEAGEGIGGAGSSCTGANFSFENTGFNKQNPFGFILKVDHDIGEPTIMRFSSSQKQGPSVNYLDL